jgi:multicomponent Na+:H+ antiporter subunit E
MQSSWRNYLGITLVMFIFWVALSGTLKWPQLLFGLIAAIFVVWFNRNLLIKPDEHPPIRLRTVFWLSGYLVKLFWDIVVANFQVAWLVLNPRMPIEPNLVDLNVDLEKVTGRVLLANSITLTPGTLTIMADEKKFLVHALTFKSGENLRQWTLIKKIKDAEEAG